MFFHFQASKRATSLANLFVIVFKKRCSSFKCVEFQQKLTNINQLSRSPTNINQQKRSKWLGDQEGVLELSRPFAITRHGRPVVRPGPGEQNSHPIENAQRDKFVVFR